MSDPVKLSYNGALWRVRCEFTRAATLESEAPPADLLARAKAKMEAVKSAGEVAFYVVFNTRLAETWKALRDAQDEAFDAKVQLTLAAGAPLLPGIKVDKPTQEKTIANLTIDAAKESIALWRWECFKLLVLKRLRDAGIKDIPNNAQLFGAFHRAKSGEKVLALPIGAGGQALGAPGKAYSVIANKQRQEIAVVVRGVRELKKKESRDQMLGLIAQAIKQMAGSGIEFRVLKKDFLTALDSATSGPEAYGVELPLVLLAALGTQPLAARPGAQAPQIPANYPGAGRLTFEVSKDKMEATVRGFFMAFYDDPHMTVNVEWIQNELKRCLLHLPMAEDVQKALTDAIMKKENIEGRVALRGSPGVGGKGPTLHHSYKEAEARVTGNIDEDNLDIRDLQQRATVKAGQLVAQIKFNEAPVVGRSVFGDELPPPPDDELVIRVGEGIQQRESGRFYATTDGTPVIDGESISLSKVLVHNGDVNLRSGNIRFDGPVEIKGSVDSGAVVESTGDVIVHGTIRSGFVRCAGSLTAMSGIVTGPKGHVQARGTITADFIENSNITCSGDLTVAKAILNSHIHCGGTIRVAAKGGVVAGGRVVSRQSIVTQCLGFRRGAVTVLEVGVDWKWARAVHIRKARLEKLQKRAGDDRQALRELVQKSKAQMTQRHKDMKDELQQRLQRFRVLVEKAEKHVESAIANLSYDPASRIYVKDLLAANVNLTVGGQLVVVTHEVAGVAILGKRKRGSHILPIEEIEAEDRDNGKNISGDQPSPKKAG